MELYRGLNPALLSVVRRRLLFKASWMISIQLTLFAKHATHMTSLSQASFNFRFITSDHEKTLNKYKFSMLTLPILNLK